MRVSVINPCEYHVRAIIVSCEVLGLDHRICEYLVLSRICEYWFELGLASFFQKLGLASISQEFGFTSFDSPLGKVAGISS